MALGVLASGGRKVPFGFLKLIKMVNSLQLLKGTEINSLTLDQG